MSRFWEQGIRIDVYSHIVRKKATICHYKTFYIMACVAAQLLQRSIPIRLQVHEYLFRTSTSVYWEDTERVIHCVWKRLELTIQEKNPLSLSCSGFSSQRFSYPYTQHHPAKLGPWCRICPQVMWFTRTDYALTLRSSGSRTTLTFSFLLSKFFSLEGSGVWSFHPARCCWLVHGVSEIPERLALILGGGDHENHSFGHADVA